MRKALGLWTSKAVELCKQNLMVHFSRIFEESSAESCVDRLWRPTQEVSGGADVGNWVVESSYEVKEKGRGQVSSWRPQGHLVKLWKWILNYDRDLKMLDVPGLWVICQGELYPGNGANPRERIIPQGAKLAERNHLSLLTSDMDLMLALMVFSLALI